MRGLCKFAVAVRGGWLRQRVFLEGRSEAKGRRGKNCGHWAKG
ncbi:MAG: hypothetical protein V2G51_07160 [bacterium JZ-2024 1]